MRLFCNFARHKNGIIIELIHMPLMRNNSFGAGDTDGKL
jgi:hypothetical protein